MFKHSFELYSRWEADSWIIVTKLARIVNLCTSAQESWITRLWEKLNKIDVRINYVRSREWKIWRFRPSAMIFRFFSWGAYPGMHSGLTVRLFLQWYWCLMFSYKKLHTWTKRMMIPKKLYKTRLRSHCENCSMNRWSNKLQNSRFFFSKSVKKSVKRGVRVLRAWSARALYARRACEAREKSVSPQSGSLFSASY